MTNPSLHPLQVFTAAYDFAKSAHGHQRRKYTGLPYIHHPQAVASIVQGVVRPDQWDAVVAAYLHDVVEDTSVSFGNIEDKFGPEVTNLVFWMTDVSRAKHGNRALRKRLDRMHIASAPALAQTIKLADLIDNTESIVEYDRNFAKVYLREKAALLDVMRLGDPGLYIRCQDLLRKHRELWDV